MPRVPYGLLASRALAKNWVDGGMNWAIAILLSDFQAAFWAVCVHAIRQLENRCVAWLGLRFRLPNIRASRQPENVFTR